jgi:hypothetical protein
MSMISLAEIGNMVREGDVAGLSSAFQRAGDWDTRETIVVSLQQLASGSIQADRAELIDALSGIVQVCEAEVGGGSYRQNCLEASKAMLAELQGG